MFVNIIQKCFMDVQIYYMLIFIIMWKSRQLFIMTSSNMLIVILNYVFMLQKKLGYINLIPLNYWKNV